MSFMTKLTQRDLAAQLGLSYATVSRVFNGDTRVTEPTRRRVLEEAERVGFRGHALARALRLKRTFAIGVVGAAYSDSYWADLLSGLDRRARAAGYHVIICHRQADAGSASEIHFLLDRRVDALVVCPHPTREDPRMMRQVQEMVPVLMLNNRLPDFPAHYIGTDSRTGSRSACEYLLSLGHRRIAFATGPEGDYTAESRLAGYRTAMDAAGVLDPALIVGGGNWRKSFGQEAARGILRWAEPPTAILAANDPIAFGIYLELRAAGVRIPEEMSLVGYSGDRSGELMSTPLTTVIQPAELLGRRTAELVMELIEDQPERLAFEELQDQLLIRASCAPMSATSKSKN
jgi:DNA-binding LacI/PurR family transcriptional regulator